MRKIVFITCLVFIFSCCSGVSRSDYDRVSNENIELTNTIEKLNQELDGYKNTPDKLLAEAQHAYETNDKDRLLEISESIQKYHPESVEYNKITNLKDHLVKNEEERIRKEKEIRLGSVSKLKKEYDDISGTTWYYQPYFTHYNNRNFTSIYIGKKKDRVWLRLKMSYNGDNWIFFENAYLSYDENTKSIYFNKYEDKQTDHDGGYVWEWIDVSVGNDLLTYLKEFQNGKSLKMRLSGKYTHTRSLSTNEIKGIKDILLAYEVLLNEK